MEEHEQPTAANAATPAGDEPEAVGAKAAAAGESAAEDGPDVAAEPADTAADGQPDRGGAAQAPRPSRRLTRRRLRRQWRHGTRGGRIVVLQRTIAEDPAGVRPEELLPDVDPALWEAAELVWADADLAMSRTVAGRLLGGQLGLAPVRGHFRFVVEVPGLGGFSDPEVRYPDPERCLAAARAAFAGDVVREAGLWRAVETAGVAQDALAARVRADLERLLTEAEEADRGAA